MRTQKGHTQLSAVELQAWMAPFQAATTIQELENAYQSVLARPGYYGLTQKADRAIADALESCGWALVEADPQGDLIPRIVRKPSSFGGTTYRGHRFVGGTWGNGPGYRWTRQSLVRWVQEVGGFAERELADTLVEWVLFGMPHRALMRLRESQAHEAGCHGSHPDPVQEP